MHDRPRKGKQLPLSRREIVAALTHDLIKPALRGVDKRIRVDIAAGGYHLVVADFGIAECDIAANRPRKQEHVLKHLPEAAAKRRKLDFPNVDAVNQDLPLLNIVVAANQRENR